MSVLQGLAFAAILAPMLLVLPIKAYTIGI
jgi:hypothetical protein